MIWVKLVVVCLACLLTANALAERKIIQIGGGNKIDNSQGQIEDNVIWLSDILKRSSDNVVNFFAAGSQPVKDVSLYGEGAYDDLMEPISRVFGERDAGRLVFKSNQVPDLSGSTEKKTLIPALEDTLSKLGSVDDLLLIYNGHGGEDPEDVRFNTLKTWGDERLNVAEMDSILDHAPVEATVRFIFPQCYSGGFYYLVYDEPQSSTIAAQNRCGFFAESPYEESEGCSLDTNRAEYRDYSTYFFAPLNGATRNAAPLPVDPDLDRDGAVSFRESHLYALRVGESKDLSRSTSEVYLEEWEPWYLRWSREDNRESIYWEIAEYVVKTHNLSMDGRKLAGAKKIVQGEMDELARQSHETSKHIDELSEGIRSQIVLRWPEVRHPYISAYMKLMLESASTISSAIRRLPTYAKLVELQDRVDELNARSLTLEREMARIDRVNRMKRLARLESQFTRYASKKEKKEYVRLLECENGVFFRH